MGNVGTMWGLLGDTPQNLPDVAVSSRSIGQFSAFPPVIVGLVLAGLVIECYFRVFEVFESASY